jgi:hypothetical protein
MTTKKYLLLPSTTTTTITLLTCAIPNANAVLPVPGAPANNNARPAILRLRIKSTTRPHASRALSCPTSPDPMGVAMPVVGFRPRPLICVCAETRVPLAVDWTSSIYNIINIIYGRMIIEERG